MWRLCLRLHPNLPGVDRPGSRGPGKEFTVSMANHVSSLKRARQTETKTADNRANKTKLRGTLRTLREAIDEGNKKTIAATYSETVSILDKSVQKGVIHKNTASRYKARLNARVKALAAPKKVA